MIKVREWVETALEHAKLKNDISAPPGIVHRERSKNFVEALGTFAREHMDCDSERVLTKHYPENRNDFGLNELLFDVLYCDTATTPAAEANVLLRYVTRGMWAVESEFHRDSRQALFDFNKLVLADVEAKLFIGPNTSNYQAYLEPLRAAAVNVNGQLFVALVPHPSKWKTKDEQKVKLFEWKDNNWKER